MTHPLVGHLVCARRMGDVLSGTASPHVEAQNASETIVFFPASFLVTHPFVGHLVCARRMGNVLSGTSSPHVEAQNASQTISFSQPVFW